MDEENIVYPVLSATRRRDYDRGRYLDPPAVNRTGENNIHGPLTPVTLATPVMALPAEEVAVRHSNNIESRPHFRNRMILCLFAITFNWGTTLRIANNFASRVIRVPSLDFVSNTCKRGYNITRDERLRYSKCVETQLNKCNKKLDQTVEEEDERVRKLAEQNEELVQRMEGVAVNCSKSYTTLRMALEDWTANGGEIPLHSNSSPNSTCSPEDQQTFNQTLLGTQNTLALQTEALQTASSYSQESALTVQRLASTISDLDKEISALDEYIKERAKYDVKYIDDKTQHLEDGLRDVIDSFDPANIPTLDFEELFFSDWVNGLMDLRACVSLDTKARMLNGSFCEPNLARLIDDFAEDAKWKVEVLNRTLYEYRETLHEYKDLADEYKENAMDAYNTAKRFYDGAKGFIKIAKPLVFWLNTDGWFDIGERDFMPIDVSFPDVDIDIPDIGTFGSIDAMWEKVEPFIMDPFGFGSMVHRIKDGLDEWIGGIAMNHSALILNLLPDIAPDDYLPPKYAGTVDVKLNPQEEISVYKNISDSFISRTRAALGMFSGIGNQYDEDQLNIGAQTFNITEIKGRVTSIDLAFEGLQQPDTDFDLWFLQLSHLTDGFVLVDYIFRAYVSIRYLMKYWFATSLAMPSIDLRINKDIKNPFKMHPARAMMAFATSPVGGFMILIASSSWIIGIVAALYAPMLQSYTSGCVSAQGNGTFITKNLFSIAYNHAYQDGSSLLIEGMDAFDLKRGDTCSSRYTSSATLQNSMASNFSVYTAFHQEMSEDMRLAQRCVDSKELDSAFGEACCGIAKYPDCAGIGASSNAMCPMDDRQTVMNIPIPYDPPGISLADPSCSVNTNESDWAIENAVFDCESIEVCSVTCPGPRKRLLTAASERCGCSMEWYLHSKWMGSTFAFVLYVFMNIARVSFFSGITKLFWKHIYPERFTVSATCNSEGSLVTPSKISGSSHQDLINAIQTRSDVDGSSTHRELSKELHAKLTRSLRSFYTTGLVLLFGSLLANGAWIYALVVTSQTLTPHVWRQ